MELYYYNPSPPCRAVLLFIHALSLKPTLKEIDITKKEQLTAEFLKLNPQHTIPVIVDDGFVLSESRAILGYLAEQYAPNSAFYPNDPKARGVVNQRLMFDIGTLYQAWLDAYLPALYAPEPIAIDPAKLQKLDEAFGYLEIFMGDSHWMAGDEVTIADFSLAATVSTIEVSGFDFSKYSKVYDWFERCKQEMVDFDEVNQKGADLLRDYLLPKIKN